MVQQIQSREFKGGGRTILLLCWEKAGLRENWLSGTFSPDSALSQFENRQDSSKTVMPRMFAESLKSGLAEFSQFGSIVPCDAIG
jgi:hypothetical protein